MITHCMSKGKLGYYSTHFSMERLETKTLVQNRNQNARKSSSSIRPLDSRYQRWYPITRRDIEDWKFYSLTYLNIALLGSIVQSILILK